MRRAWQVVGVTAEGVLYAAAIVGAWAALTDFSAVVLTVAFALRLPDALISRWEREAA